MPQNLLSHIKEILIDGQTKIWTEITDIAVFRKKLLKFLQCVSCNCGQYFHFNTTYDIMPRRCFWLCFIGIGHLSVGLCSHNHSCFCRELLSWFVTRVLARVLGSPLVGSFLYSGWVLRSWTAVSAIGGLTKVVLVTEIQSRTCPCSECASNKT